MKIFTALLLVNVNLTRPQTTKSAFRFWRSISQNENDFLWGCSHRHFSGFKLLYRLDVTSVNIFLKIKNQESLQANL